ncbi:hypothetical protein EOD43_03080 [Sphingomonas crocodyli]|uniref:Outer membrane protein beta-barrel domain-containing protein n=2 Tax=Sphingomonas crocodyli TaxID=1979270 RepID=A0A437MBT6_9SPHN|nr:hypothetical protein EOD43_03080 [Sphingomonas crocodyli]
MCSAVPAHAADLGLEAGGARYNDVWGAEVGVTYRVGVSRFYLAPTVGAFIYQGDNDRYYEQTFTNGNTVCRDSTNGQFAKKEKCDNTAIKPYARLEAGINIPAFGAVGGGARFSTSKVVPYGTVSINLAPSIRVKGNAGKDYYALGLTAGL